VPGEEEPPPDEVLAALVASAARISAYRAAIRCSITRMAAWR
jgi:hypothetical protein